MWSLQFTHRVDCFERSKHGIDTVARAEYARRMNAGAYIREKMGSWTNPHSLLKEIRTIPLTSRPNEADLTGPALTLRRSESAQPRLDLRDFILLLVLEIVGP